MKASIIKRQHIIYLSIFLVALGTRLYMIQLDPFLNDWDERFHALVARNLMSNPFKPMLHQEHLMWFNYKGWVFNEVWLHKQPLFMWQMALSMKLFGVSEISIRIPSAILGALSCLALYRIAFLTWSNERIALVSAMLLCFSYYQLELISGHMGMEHNDLAFSCYILFSAWAYFEYLQNKNFKWAILIGFFAGCAVLNKWLTGILIFAPWCIYLLRDIIKNKKFSELRYILPSIFVCCLVFVPWQIYILQTFPVEALFEYNFSSRHVFEVVEGHKGNWDFYFLQFYQYFGEYIYYFIPVGILFSLRKFNKFHRTNFILISVVFVFFSFIAASKLPSFFFIVVPFLLMYLAAGSYAIISRLNKSIWVYALCVLPLFWFTLNPLQIDKNHDRKQANFQRKEANTKVYKQLAQDFKKDIHVVNINTTDNIELLFYNHHFLGCDWEMPKDTLKYYLDRGYDIVTTKESLDSLSSFQSYENFHVFNYSLKLQKP